jgi:signal transduction histidine kinase
MSSGFRLGLALFALIAIGVAGALAMVWATARAGEAATAQALADAEMANVASKMAGLDPDAMARELALLAPQRHLASQIARGAADPTRSSPCATPARDRRVVSARFEGAIRPGEGADRIAGAPLDWDAPPLVATTTETPRPIALRVPAGAACNRFDTPARATVRRFGEVTLVTAWMVTPDRALVARHWPQALLATLLTSALGLLAALAVARQSRARMRRLTGVLAAVGEGRFDVAATVPGERGEPAGLSASIDAMTARLRALTDAMASLIDRTAHDLRTPLARAVARVSEAARQSPPDARPALEAARDDLTALSRRFDAMLALRETSARGLAGARRVDLAEVAGMAVELYADLDLKPGLAFASDLVPAPVRGDPGLLQNAVANLIDNAVKFSPEGGVIVVATGTDADGAFVTVTDAGEGLDPAIAAAAMQAGVATGRPGGGYGLGLATVADVAALHGGRATLSPGPAGRGLTARIALPPWTDGGREPAT